MENIGNIIKRLGEPSEGDFGIIQTDFDWLPGADRDSVPEMESIALAMPLEKAGQLRDLAKALHGAGMDYVDIVLYPGAVKGEGLKGVSMMLERTRIGRDQVRPLGMAKGPMETQVPPMGWDFSVSVGSGEIRFVIQDDDENPVAAAVFGPEGLADRIRDALDMAHRQAKGPSPR